LTQIDKDNIGILCTLSRLLSFVHPFGSPPCRQTPTSLGDC